MRPASPCSQITDQQTVGEHIIGKNPDEMYSMNDW